MEPVTVSFCSEQHVHFIFKALARNPAQPVQHLRREAAKAGLGILNPLTGAQRIYHAGGAVAKAAS
ncbi:hypothetical protein D3C73_1477710 [compost metagenome]